jgi:hypothetical protein
VQRGPVADHTLLDRVDRVDWCSGGSRRAASVYLSAGELSSIACLECLNFGSHYASQFARS